MGRHIKTKPRNVRRGFTLMEVLVASSIFAVVMVFVTGAVVASSNYQSKIRIMNQTSEESRRLADMITRDVRSANFKLSINPNGTSSSGGGGTSGSTIIGDGTTLSDVYNFKNGIAIIKSMQVSYYSQNSLTHEPIDADTLIISLKDTYKIYSTKSIGPDTYGLYYREIPRAGNDTLYVTGLFPTILSELNNYLISKENLSVDVKFGGYAPDDLHVTGQPMIKFYISVGSQNEGTYNYYKTAIRSAVTSRSYNE